MWSRTGEARRVETPILNDGELLIGRRFDTGDLARQWAAAGGEAHKRAGWTSAKQWESPESSFSRFGLKRLLVRCDGRQH
jgi:hypothetical protein